MYMEKKNCIFGKQYETDVFLVGGKKTFLVKN